MPSFNVCRPALIERIIHDYKYNMICMCIIITHPEVYLETCQISIMELSYDGAFPKMQQMFDIDVIILLNII